MVATQEQVLTWKVDPAGYTIHKAHEVLRAHPGITTVLVDLVAGGFDQDRGALRQAVEQGGFEDEGMRRADRGQAAGLASFLGCNDAIKLVHGMADQLQIELAS